MPSTYSENMNNNSKINTSIESSMLGNLTIIDASYHPAKVITPIFRQYSQISGPNSQTLMSMGWYPSGKLVILSLPRTKPASSISSSSSSTAEVAAVTSSPVTENSYNRDAEEEQLLNRFIEWHHRFVLQYEEGAYNNPTDNNFARQKSNGSAGVQWTGIGAVSASNSSSQPIGNGIPTTLKPSEIFHAIEQRSISDVPSTKKNNILKKTKSRSRRTEMERSARLNSLLQKLDTDNKKMKKNRGVSQKVRSMLLKSNSLGDKKLRMEDRFHLEVVYLSDLEAKSSYRFYSRQTTAGKVASSLAPSLGKDMAEELIVSYPPPPKQQPKERPEQPNGVRRYRRLPNTMTLHDAQSLQQRLHTLFQSLNGNSTTTSTLPKSKAKKKPMSKQVRAMLMKSKSVGNTRIKQEDRIYLEVIFFRDSGGTDADAELSYSSSYRFFSKQMDLRQIVDAVRTSSSDDNGNTCTAKTVQFIVPHRSSEKEEEKVVVYQSLDESTTLGDAMSRGYIDNFGLVVLRAFS
ncbi:hypothetical protein ACHAXH_005687 [Discostella pseudostelligera]